MLHVAGRPTNDVRALRQWLKSDASVDVVAFFILRTPTDDVRAVTNELALIPFPVDELFTEHLPSFDAVVLQDFDAQPYGLEKYLENIRATCAAAGGSSWSAVRTPSSRGATRARRSPTCCRSSSTDRPGRRAPTRRRSCREWTARGARRAAARAAARRASATSCRRCPAPTCSATCAQAGSRSGRTRRARRASGAKMPVLAIGDEGDGRTIALGVDGAWELEFSELGARTAGRGHGALWDGLLGWLMRDPRFEPAQIEIVGGCTRGLALRAAGAVCSAARAARAPTAAPVIELDVTRIDGPRAPLHIERPAPDGRIGRRPAPAGARPRGLHGAAAARRAAARRATTSRARQAATSGLTRARTRSASRRSPGPPAARS